MYAHRFTAMAPPAKKKGATLNFVVWRPENKVPMDSSRLV
jgi:hypothetical protein